jgi:uncharacterized protein (UPF0335 family)
MIKNNVKVNAQRSVAELEMIISQLNRDMSRLKRYLKHLENALVEAKGDGFDVEMFRKAFYATLKDEAEADGENGEDNGNGEPRTPSKSSPASSGGPSTPTTPRATPMSPAVFSYVMSFTVSLACLTCRTLMRRVSQADFAAPECSGTQHSRAGVGHHEPVCAC